MADTKVKTEETEAPKTIRAGVSMEEEKVAKAEVKEDREIEALASQPEPDGLDKLPEGAALASVTTELPANYLNSAAPHEFDDEFRGQGGSYIIDGETGERKPVYEAFVNSEGKTQYRRVG